MSPEQLAENQLIELLAVIYNTIDWRKIKTRHNAYDIFNHRVRAASRRATLFEAISKLANYFGLQSLPPEAIGIMQKLRDIEGWVLAKMYTEHIPISMLAIMRAKERREEKKGERKCESNLEEDGK